jgi:membrane-associated phospholipid phosphatase
MGAAAHPPESPAVEQGAGARIGTSLAIGLFAAAVALALFVWLGYLIRTGAPTAFDLAVRSGLRSLESPGLTALMWGASVYGGPLRLSPFVLASAAVFLLRGWRRGALLVVVTLAGAWLLDVVLKELFARARPDAFFQYYPAPRSFSFPSGHALFATCFFGGIAVLLSHRIRARPLQVLVWATLSHGCDRRVRGRRHLGGLGGGRRSRRAAQASAGLVRALPCQRRSARALFRLSPFGGRVPPSGPADARRSQQPLGSFPTDSRSRRSHAEVARPP